MQATVFFDASQSTADAGRTIVSYQWNWGDGSGLATVSTPLASHSSSNSIFSKPKNGTFTTALLAALYSTYARHLPAAQSATLTVDRTNMAKWSKAYAAAKAPLQSLVTAWAKYVQQLK